MVRLLLWISRILFGTVFIFSGFVKAIDPLGSAYKFQDYFLAFNMEWLSFTAIPLAVILSTLEFVIGVAVLAGLKMRWSAVGGLLFMVFFTPLTLYVALADPVPDCGCFGDALIISNWDTFFKNIVILAAAIIIFYHRKKIKPLLSGKRDWWLIGAVAIFIVGLSVYCLRYLPLIDFRPWKTGNDVSQLMTPTPEVADLFLIYENQETGELKEWPANDFPWDDPRWTAVWKYKDQRKEIIQPHIEAPISDFVIQDEFGDEWTESLLFNPDHQFILVAYDLGSTNTRAFQNKVTPLAMEAQTRNYSFVVLTGSTFEQVEAFRHEHQTPYPFFQSDEISLKTIIRSNPGLLLMKNGVVLEKWPHRCIPTFEEIQEQFPDL
ncbi:MAG: DoxX family protein [Bacteroidales bacterium]